MGIELEITGELCTYHTDSSRIESLHLTLDSHSTYLCKRFSQLYVTFLSPCG